MINEETDEVIKELFDPLKKNIKIGLESIKHSELVFEDPQRITKIKSFINSLL